ncbi:hypothetical protein KIF59_22455 [Enterobacter cloacae subsp. cloacae]|nr:hypothetical protein [Enterobacter cloacae subsp. cloacae]
MADAVQRHATLWPVASNAPRRTPEPDARPVVRFPPLIFRLMAQRWCTGNPSGGGRAGADAEWPAILICYRLAQQDPIAAFTLAASGAAALRLASAAGARPCEIACATCWFAQCCLLTGMRDLFWHPPDDPKLLAS